MLSKAIALCLVVAACQLSIASAAGPFGRMRGSVQRSAGTYASPNYRATPYANRAYGGTTTRTAPGGARYSLPAGRSYYQGRYYGHLNNRFYGPQYGYF